MKFVAALLAIAIVLVNYQIWVDDQGLPALRRLGVAVEERTTENAQLGARNATLAAEVADLRTGLEAVEERARRELGMLRDDEVFFQVDASLLRPGGTTPAGAAATGEPSR